MGRLREMFMSANPTALKKIVFDSLFFTYSVILVTHLIASATSGIFGTHLDQDFFLQHFSIVMMASFVLWSFTVLAAWFAHRLELATVGDVLFSNFARKLQIHETSFHRSFWGIHVSIVFLLTLLLSLQVTQASMIELLDRDGLAGAWRLWLGITNPNFALLSRAIIEAIETIYIAFLATVIAIPIAFVLAFLCAKNIMIHPLAFTLYSILRLGMNVSRSIEPLIWALIFTVWVGVGPFAGMLALMIHSVSSLTKYYSEILESVDERPIDGVRSTGANSLQVIWFAIVPQIVLPYIAMTIYRWDTNVRMATVIGLVGGGGIGTLLIQYQGQAMWREVGCIILVIAIIVWLMDVASAYVREALK